MLGWTSGGSFDPIEVLSEIRSELPIELHDVLNKILLPERVLRPRGAQEARSLLRGADLTVLGVDASLGCDGGIVMRDDALYLFRWAKRRALRSGGHVLVLMGPRGVGKSTLGRLYQIETLAEGGSFAEVSWDALRQVESKNVLESERSVIRIAGLDLHAGPRGPAILLVDGIETLSPEDLEIIIAEASAVRGPTLLLVMCDQISSESESAWSGVGRKTPGELFTVQFEEIGAMLWHEVGLLVGETTGTTPCSGLVDWLVEHTDSSPQFVRELTGFLASKGCLQRSPEGLVLDVSRADEAGVPDSVWEMLRKRLADLSSAELEVARIAALGLGITGDIIAEITGLPALDVNEALRRLDVLSLASLSHVCDIRGLTDNPVSRLLWPESDGDLKRKLHEQAAHILNESGDDDPPERRCDGAVAWHLARAGRYGNALPIALAATIDALDADRLDESERHLDLVDEILTSSSDVADSTLSSLVYLSAGYWRAGRTSSCARVSRLGLEVAARNPSAPDDELIELLWLLGRAAILSGDPDGALRALDRALELSMESKNRIRTAGIRLSFCMVHQVRGEFREVDRLADESIALLEGTGRSDLVARSYSSKGNALHALCEWKSSLAWSIRAVQASREDENSCTPLSVYVSNVGWTNMRLGNWEVAEEHLAEALSLASSAGIPYQSQLALLNMGCLWTRRGVFEKAAQCLQDASSWAERTGDEWGLAMILVDMGQLEFARGNPGFALGYYDRAEALMSEVGSVDDLPELLRARAEALSAQGRHGEAREAAEESHKLSTKMENLLEIANSSRVLGEIAAHGGELDRALGLCGDATDALRAMGAPYELAQSLAATARVYRERGESRDAVALLEEARDTFRDLGARRDSRVIQEELAEMAGALQLPAAELPGEREHLASLYRSSQVLASSESQREAARELADIAAAGIPAETVAVHLLQPGSTGITHQSSLCEREGVELEVQEQVPVFLKHLAEGEPIIRVAHNDQRSGALSTLLAKHNLRSLLIVPMTLREQLIGLIYLDYRKRDATFSDEDVRFVEALAAQAATAIDNVRLRADLEEELETLRWEVDSRFSFANIIGQSVKMQELFSLLQKVAATSVTVLIEGDSGTGKELVARAIHFNSSRKHARFIPQNCAALPEQLLESELFGHVRGAFTGALKEKGGLFEAADRGTFFLDEIADMPPALQVKLLRVLQDGEIRRVGATEPIKVDVRIVAATNKSLEEEVKAGRFREDLFYRLNVVRMRMPVLRERRDDIPLLAQHFLDLFSDECGKSISGFTDHAMDLLVNYDWPGNVRELENEIQRAVALSKPRVPISAQSLSERFHSVEVAIKPPRPGVQLSLKDMVEGVERRVILQMLGEHKWNKSRTAEALGLSRQGLLKKIARLNLTPDEK
jgi:Nif-specific regulatory protein